MWSAGLAQSQHAAHVYVERLDDGDGVAVAGWPVARQHPRGQDGTVFVTIEDETGRRSATARYSERVSQGSSAFQTRWTTLPARNVGVTRMPSSIEWTDETWNPVTGCSRVSPGCDNCYMFAMYPRLKAMRVPGYETSPGVVQLQPDRLELPLSWRQTTSSLR